MPLISNCCFNWCHFSVHRLQHWCSSILKASKEILRHLWTSCELNKVSKNSFSSCPEQTVNVIMCILLGKLHWSTDQAAVCLLWGVLLHPCPPHRCCHRLPDSSKSTVHRTMTAEQNLKRARASELASEHKAAEQQWESSAQLQTPEQLQVQVLAAVMKRGIWAGTVGKIGSTKRKSSIFFREDTLSWWVCPNIFSLKYLMFTYKVNGLAWIMFAK